MQFSVHVWSNKLALLFNSEVHLCRDPWNQTQSEPVGGTFSGRVFDIEVSPQACNCSCRSPNHVNREPRFKIV